MPSVSSDGSGNLQEPISNLILGGLNAGQITPTTLTANTDNYAPTGAQNATVIRLNVSNGGSGINLTGIAAACDGKAIVLMNISTTSDNIVLKHNLTSTAANRFFCPNSADVTLRPNGFVWIIYDQTSSRWRVMGA